MNRILYHGTSSVYLRDILENGIRPRVETNNSNWPKNPSKSGLVYLSRSYVLHFASVAADKVGGNMVLLACDIGGLRLYPDEDSIAQYMCYNGMNSGMDSGMDLIELTNSIDHRDYADNVSFFYDLLGNVSTEVIESLRIKGYVVFKPDISAIKYIDLTITIANYRFMGDYYAKVHDWFFEPHNCFPHRYPDEYYKALPEIKESEDKYIEAMNSSVDKDFSLVIF